jgi:DNA-binding NarL/FixJ family response regulator
MAFAGTRSPEPCDRAQATVVPLAAAYRRSRKGRWRDLAVHDSAALARPCPPRAQAAPDIRVLLAESVGLVRVGLRSLLERERDMTVVGEATSGEEAVALAVAVRPDVVLMDIRVAGLGALAATRRLLAGPDPSGVPVVIIAPEEREDDLYAALRSGASGFVFLETDPLELLLTVRAVAAGDAQLSPWATRWLIAEFASGPAPLHVSAAVFDGLTTRERDIASLVARGLTNDEIAKQLVVSPATVKTHVSRAMLKLHVQDRAKLVAIAYQSGFVRYRAADEIAVLDRCAAPPIVR